jgi:hypothetical protein
MLDNILLQFIEPIEAVSPHDPLSPKGKDDGSVEDEEEQETTDGKEQAMVQPIARLDRIEYTHQQDQGTASDGNPKTPSKRYQ